MAISKIIFKYASFTFGVICVFISIRHYVSVGISVENKTFMLRPTIPFAKDVIEETGKES